jgi:hypothetical protein
MRISSPQLFLLGHDRFRVAAVSQHSPLQIDQNYRADDAAGHAEVENAGDKLGNVVDIAVVVADDNVVVPVVVVVVV